ncbi:acyl-CoA dehydrogenase family protein [Sphingobium sp. AP49]|uniref:acyl-CoA dehydrogenase family protein n=1 Tax=Sphingobium sp. AP49 TaxID=1144307 RepID=UPI0024B3B7EB|nr:acyl-CoA dehydrogenase family protein [Sphingobium sp. AP49]WHO38937.1 acyl-CoA dehydrogenase family protein [Sphingobium sp. AP49]
MDLSLTDDQIAILDAIDTLTRPYAGATLHEAGFALTSDALDRDLAEGGFLDIGFDPDLGAISAALVVERLARLPQAVEAAASALIRPLLGDATPRPLCLGEEGKAHRPIRFLAPGATVLLVGPDRVRSFVAGPEHVRTEPEALYAYPMGSLIAQPDDLTDHDVSAGDIRTRWRVALAAEAAGLLAAALDSTATYVTDRQQFGRPLATFQALRHRLAEAQVRANGLYWLAMKAAGTLDAGDAALAALYAQESARTSVYDFHQFLGAMGVTLEHPLHLWTYRLKALIGDLGGRGGQALAAADALWG